MVWQAHDGHASARRDLPRSGRVWRGGVRFGPKGRFGYLRLVWVSFGTVGYGLVCSDDAGQA